ncbi:MAG: nickel insertion protein [Paenibacillaceae bacterium]
MAFEHADEHLDKQMTMIQVNIDDMNPEQCSYVMDLLFEQGANDVCWVPIIMKKGRPGLQLQVLTDLNLLSALETIIFRETTTLGLRYLPATVHRLARAYVKVQTIWGEMTVKVGYHVGELVQYAPEFTECEQVAKLHHIPLKQVYDEVRHQFKSVQPSQI